MRNDLEEQLLAVHRRAQDEYDFDELSHEVARKRGLVVVLPKPNQLQLDLDSEEAFVEYLRRKDSFDFDETVNEIISPSSSGLPKRHVTLTFQNREFSAWERVAMQAALGSDIIREFLSARRIWVGIENPSALFEKP